jgi:class 3 adenylate cyclase
VKRIFPFKYKLTLLIAAIVVTLVAATFFAFQSNVEAEFRALIEKQLEQTERFVGLQMDARYDHLFNNTTALAENRLIREILTDRAMSEKTRNDIVASEVFPNLVDIDVLAVVDGNGALLARAQPEPGVIAAVLTAPWFSDSLVGRESLGHEVVDGRYFQAIGMPTFLGEEMLGIIVAGRSLTAEDLARIKQSSSVDLGILAGSSVALSTPWSTKRRAESPNAFVLALDAWLAAHPDVLAQQSPATEVSLRGERFLLRVARDATGFVPSYVVVQSLDLRLAFLDDLRLGALGIISAGVAVGLAAAFLLAVGISRPIRELLTATGAVAREKFDHRVRIATSDEFSTLGDAFNDMIAGLGEKQRIRSAFDKSVSREVADHILSGDIEPGGETRTASLLFADIRNFTAIAEALGEKKLVAMQNVYFSACAESVARHHGTIDKFIGDAVMAMFGAPVERADHALCALLAAHEMRRAVARIEVDMGTGVDSPIEIGVGVNTGQVVAGLVGSRERLAYTVSGDEVNLASRLEGLTKHYGAGIILSEATLHAVQSAQGDAPGEFAFRELDLVRVKGRTRSVRLYEALARSECLQDLDAYLAAFDSARGLVAKRHFELATRELIELRRQWPEDRVGERLLERARRYHENTAAYDTDYRDGVRIFDQK